MSNKNKRSYYETKNNYKSNIKYTKKAEKVADRPVKKYQREMDLLKKNFDGEQTKSILDYSDSFCKHYNINKDDLFKNNNSRLLILLMLKARCDKTKNDNQKLLDKIPRDIENEKVIKELTTNINNVINMENDIDNCTSLNYLKNIESSKNLQDNIVNLVKNLTSEDIDERTKKDNLELIELINKDEFFIIVKNYLKYFNEEDLSEKIFQPLMLINRLITFMNIKDNLVYHRFFIANTLKNLAINNFEDPLLEILIKEISIFTFTDKELELIKETDVSENIERKEKEIAELEEEE